MSAMDAVARELWPSPARSRLISQQHQRRTRDGHQRRKPQPRRKGARQVDGQSTPCSRVTLGRGPQLKLRQPSGATCAQGHSGTRISMLRISLWRKEGGPAWGAEVRGRHRPEQRLETGRRAIVSELTLSTMWCMAAMTPAEMLRTAPASRPDGPIAEYPSGRTRTSRHADEVERRGVLQAGRGGCVRILRQLGDGTPRDGSSGPCMADGPSCVRDARHVDQRVDMVRDRHVTEIECRRPC